MKKEVMKTKYLVQAYAIISAIWITTALADGILDENSNASSSRGSATAGNQKSSALSDQELLNYQYCGKDSDCVEVINGCCQCLQGDKYISVAKDRLQSFREKFQCLNVSCPKEDESINCDEGVVSCINHRCTYQKVDL